MESPFSGWANWSRFGSLMGGGEAVSCIAGDLRYERPIHSERREWSDRVRRGKAVFQKHAEDPSRRSRAE